ncbi:MAG: exodeoxyribonuclease VII large subunit [Bacillota bacterium]|jgi:exodeoxyribonuclease VII large subunit
MAEVVEFKRYSVSDLNYYLKELLLEDDFLTSLAIQGEVANYKEHSSGHVYFTLRDEKAAIRCVMFRHQARKLTFSPQNGMQIVVFGSASLYERDGSCQLYAQELFADGVGQEFMALEQLKEKLAQEGLFAQKNKKPLPFFAKSIGVVSSAEGAAWADIQKVAYQRWPHVELMLYPTLVQGEAAAQKVAEALLKADQNGHDVLLLSRGGGSSEDLAAFNTETVVRAIATAKTPIITAIGHEVDFTLADLAADVRAATPSHASEIIVPDQEVWQGVLQQYQERLQTLCLRKISDKRADVDVIERRLHERAEARYRQKEEQFIKAMAALDHLNPLAILERGYALCTDQADRQICDSRQVELGQELQVRLARGVLLCQVTGKELAK